MSPTEAKDYGIIDAVYSATAAPLTAKVGAADAPDGDGKPADDGSAPGAQADRE